MTPNLDRILDASPGRGEIWQGDAASALYAPGRFDLLVLCAEEWQPDHRLFGFRLGLVYAPNDDAELTRAQLRIAREAATFVTEYVRSGRNALVTCMAGRNRSGLVSALALHALTGCGGRKATEIVQRRRVGAAALTNPSFTRVLRLLPPAGPSRAT